MNEGKCLLVGFDRQLHNRLTQLCPETWLDRAETVEEALGFLREIVYEQLILDSHAPKSLEFLRHLNGITKLDEMKRAVCLDRKYNNPEVIHAVLKLKVSRVFYHPIEPKEIARELATTNRLTAPSIPLVPMESKKSRTIGPLVRTFKEVTRSRLLRMLIDAPTASDDPTARRELQREAHKLKGSMGSFGFPRGSELAAKLESHLRSGNCEPNLITQSCREILTLLDQECEALVTQNSGEPVVLIYTSDEDLMVDLTSAASVESIRTLVLNNAEDVKELILSSTVTATIIDLQSNREDGLGLIRFLTRGHVCRVVALTPDKNSDSLMEAASEGAWKVMDRSAPAEKVLSFARPLSGASSGNLRVLTVDDDPIVLAQLKNTLTSMGLNHRGVLQPERFWEELEDFAPDMILLDLDMPRVGGLELCRALRASTRWGELPIIVLTGRLDHETKFRVFRAGADDFVSKPIVEPELRQRIANRLGRSRVERERAERDPLTGLLTRRKAISLLRQLLSQSTQRSVPMSLAVVDLDRFKSVNDTYGHGMGDQVLKNTANILQSAFREGDVVARWGGEEIVIGASRMSEEMLIHRLQRILGSVQAVEYKTPDGARFSTSFSAGVAEFPSDGADLNALLEKADEALYRAKEEGRARVLRASSANRVRRVAVTLVEDDSSLAEVIRHACADRCITVEHFDNAEDFLRSQDSEIPLRQNLVILDYDIPDMDGLSVYQHLKDSGVHQKVMMLSGRMGEEETLRALELGAEHCLQKPIHLSVLMRHIEKLVRT